MNSCWNSFEGRGKAAGIFVDKLRELKKRMKLWCRSSFGNVGVLKKKNIKKLDLKEEEELKAQNSMIAAGSRSAGR